MKSQTQINKFTNLSQPDLISTNLLLSNMKSICSFIKKWLSSSFFIQWSHARLINGHCAVDLLFWVMEAQIDT